MRREGKLTIAGHQSWHRNLDEFLEFLELKPGSLPLVGCRILRKVLQRASVSLAAKWRWEWDYLMGLEGEITHGNHLAQDLRKAQISVSH